MKFRFVAPAIVAAALLTLSGNAHAGLFSHGASCGCEPTCGAPDVVWGSNCGSQPSVCDCAAPCATSCHRNGLGLLHCLKRACKPRRGLFGHHRSCHGGCEEVSRGCEPACGADVACAAEPACGCEPAYRAEASCGCEPVNDCGCHHRKRRGGLLKRLFSHKRSRCGQGCDVGCSCEPACGVAVAPTCGCN